MDRTALEDLLVKIECEVADGKRLIEDQRTRIAVQQMKGRNTNSSPNMLAALQRIQKQLEADRDHILWEINNA